MDNRIIIRTWRIASGTRVERPPFVGMRANNDVAVEWHESVEWSGHWTFRTQWTADLRGRGRGNVEVESYLETKGYWVTYSRRPIAFGKIWSPEQGPELGPENEYFAFKLRRITSTGTPTLEEVLAEIDSFLLAIDYGGCEEFQ